MGKNANFVSHKKSKQIVNGKPKLPLATDLVEGEIAINFGKDVETLSIKNESGDVVTFSSDNYYTEQKLGSGFTGENSGVTVTEALENFEITVDQDFSNTASTNPISTKAVYKAVTDNELVWTNAFVALSSITSAHTANTEIHVTSADKEKINSIGTLSGTVTAHTANTDIHVTAADKEKLHTHTNKTALDSITGNVGTMAYQNANNYSSATEVQTALSGKANTASTLSGYGITDAYTKSETSGATELTTAFSAKANTTDLANFFDDAKYEDSGATKVINFYHGNTIKATIDASDFIVDGMVEDVRIENGYLIIDFNTASGKQDISIPLTDIFDPSNYYNKTAIDNLVGSGFTSSSITDVIIENEEIVSAALTDLDERKLDASAYTPTDLSNYYTKSETSGATELTTAFSGKLDASEYATFSATTNASINDLSGQSETVAAALNDLNENKLDVSAYTPTDLSNYYTKDETSGKTEISTALGSKVNSATYTGHTADTSMHFTTTEKTNLDSLATNIAAISGITATKVSNWDDANTKKHTHSNKTALDSITGSVGTMAYEDKTSYSSATQVNTALSGKSDTGHTHTKSQITDFPTSMPASDVSAWAKASTKPTYIASEVMSISTVAINANTSSSCSITGSSNAGKAQTIIYTNSGSSDVTVTVPTTYQTPDGAAIELTCPVGGYCEVSYLNIGGTIYARGL